MSDFCDFKCPLLELIAHFMPLPKGSSNFSDGLDYLVCDRPRKSSENNILLVFYLLSNGAFCPDILKGSTSLHFDDLGW